MHDHHAIAEPCLLLRAASVSAMHDHDFSLRVLDHEGYTAFTVDAVTKIVRRSGAGS